MQTYIIALEGIHQEPGHCHSWLAFFECWILVSRSKRGMQRNQVFGSGTTENQWIIEGEKWSITFHPSGDEPIIPELFV